MQMFGNENGVCNYLALENIYGMLILRICPFSPPELSGSMLFTKKHHLTKGGFTGTPWPPWLRPRNREFKKAYTKFYWEMIIVY